MLPLALSFGGSTTYVSTSAIVVVEPRGSPSCNVPFKQQTSDGLAMTLSDVAPLMNSDVFSTCCVCFDSILDRLIYVGTLVFIELCEL